MIMYPKFAILISLKIKSEDSDEIDLERGSEN
jgi:hypothetical protein